MAYIVIYKGAPYCPRFMVLITSNGKKINFFLKVFAAHRACTYLCHLFHRQALGQAFCQLLAKRFSACKKILVSVIENCLPRACLQNSLLAKHKQVCISEQVQNACLSSMHVVFVALRRTGAIGHPPVQVACLKQLYSPAMLMLILHIDGVRKSGERVFPKVPMSNFVMCGSLICHKGYYCIFVMVIMSC